VSVSLECCVCGNGAGRFKQHWNRDDGYGICRSCVEWLVRERNTSAEEIRDLYGIEGVNYAGPPETGGDSIVTCTDGSTEIVSQDELEAAGEIFDRLVGGAP